MKTVNKTETTCFYFTGISFDNAQELTTQTGNAKKPPLHRPSEYKPPGGSYLEIALKYKVKQNKNS